MREAVAKAIHLSGLPFLIRHAIARSRATIVHYHAPRPEVLDRHLAWLARRYAFIPLERLVQAIHARDWSGIPPYALVVTLDDGHMTNRAALDVFRRHGVVPTLYLCSQIAGTRRHFWFRFPAADVDALMRLPTHERLRRLAAAGYSPTAQYPEAERQALSREEIAEMADGVEFGSHSRFHPVLTMCSDQECAEEIVVSHAEVEALTGRRCDHFAYPNGDYTEREIELVRSAGYRSARTIDVGWNGANTDPYRLKVTGVADDASVHRLAAQLSGVMGYLRYLRRGSLRGRWPTILPEQRRPFMATATAEKARSGSPPAFIVGLGENGYGVLRSLARERVRAVGFATRPEDFGRCSRYCETQALPDSLDDRQTVRALIERARNGAGKPVLFPTSDRHTSILARHREALAPHFHFHWVEEEALRHIVDKARMSRVCGNAGVLTPRTHVVGLDEDLAGPAEGLSFPCLIKPNRSFDTPFPADIKNVIVRSPAEFLALYREHPELRGATICQEIIEGGDDAIFQCTALIRASGEVGALFCARKLHQFRPGYGVMCFGRSEENDAVAALTLRLLRALQYRGLASLEFKRRARDGRYYFIEMNPRLPWYNSLFLAGGVNLPYLAYRDLAGGPRPQPAVPRQRDGIHWISFKLNLGWLLLSPGKARARLLSWLRSLARARSCAWFDWRDPMPFLRATTNLVVRLCQELYAGIAEHSRAAARGWFERHAK
ncbi:MAG TPA: polysaccharide deacetylase family protein [Burkholderiales bacterium]|nr:polysaccharide deacetylase family protein [Burkholderiales bacterium]